MNMEKKESSISGAAKLLVEPALQTDIAIMYIWCSNRFNNNKIQQMIDFHICEVYMNNRTGGGGTIHPPRPTEFLPFTQ